MLDRSSLFDNGPDKLEPLKHEQQNRFRNRYRHKSEYRPIRGTDFWIESDQTNIDPGQWNPSIDGAAIRKKTNKKKTTLVYRQRLYDITLPHTIHNTSGIYTFFYKQLWSSSST